MHGNKYDYSKVEYKTTHKKVTIICPEHGEFEQSSASHKGGAGCPSCAGNEVLDVTGHYTLTSTSTTNSITYADKMYMVYRYKLYIPS